LIVNKHQSQQQHQTNNPPVERNYHEPGDGSESSGDFLSDSTIETMRMQVKLQREKVEDER